MTLVQRLKKNVMPSGIYLAVFVLLANLPMANAKFILLSGLILCCCLYLSFKSNSILIIKEDLYWLLFYGLLTVL